MPLPKDLCLGVDVAKRRPLRDETYTTLRRAILSGTFAPGDRLVQHDVADRLGPSRSPVREALQHLEQEGLVQSTRQGLVVRGLEPGEVEELYRIRANLEAYAARLAARNFRPEHLPLFQAALAKGAAALKAQDDEGVADAGFQFHEALAEIAGNRRLVLLLASITEEIDRFRRINMAMSPRGVMALAEHRLLLDALVAHDEETAARVMADHVERALAKVQLAP
jgi:DNA-binding GntR family transcriptional regulator